MTKHLNGLSTSLSGTATKSFRISWQVNGLKGPEKRQEQWRDEEEKAIEQQQLTAHAQWVCLKLSGGSISWRSRKQSYIALSTAEAEYVSLTSAAQEPSS